MCRRRKNHVCRKGKQESGIAAYFEKRCRGFCQTGFSSDEIPDIVIKAVTEGTVVEYQRRRPIYEAEIKGNRHRISVTEGSADSSSAPAPYHFQDRRRSTCRKPVRVSKASFRVHVQLFTYGCDRCFSEGSDFFIDKLNLIME